MISPRFAVVMTAAVPPGPKEAEESAAPCRGSGGDRVQWPPPSADQAASRLAAGPVPAVSSAASALPGLGQPADGDVLPG